MNDDAQHLFGHLDDEGPLPLPGEGMLDVVVSRGSHLKRRRQMAYAGVSTATLGLVVIAAVAITAGNRGTSQPDFPSASSSMTDPAVTQSASHHRPKQSGGSPTTIVIAPSGGTIAPGHQTHSRPPSIAASATMSVQPPCASPSESPPVVTDPTSAAGTGTGGDVCASPSSSPTGSASPSSSPTDTATPTDSPTP